MQPVSKTPRSASPAVGIDLKDALASIEGLGLESDAPLARLNTFRIGGAAELLAEVRTETALVQLLRAVDRTGTPFHLLGLGSNLLVPDHGIPGVVARLAGEFKEAAIEDDRVIAGGAVTLATIARRTAADGLLGLEALSGFPSTVGGAVCMNAGCYGTEIADVLEVVRVVDRRGGVRDLQPTDLELGYRSSRLQKSGGIVMSATFRLTRGDGPAALARIDELNRKRWQSLPSGNPNVGSIFKNPEGDHAGRLIDQCGLKGLRRGDAQISPKHANVIVNLSAATAADVLDLMVEARRAVKHRFGVELEPEVVLAGGLRAVWNRRVSAPDDSGV